MQCKAMQYEEMQLHYAPLSFMHCNELHCIKTTAFCENQLTLKDTLSETGCSKVGNLHGWMKKLPHNID